MNEFLKIGLIGAAAWFVWQAIANAGSAASTSTTGTTPTPSGPVPNTSLIAALNQAMPGYWVAQPGQPAQFNGTANVSQWNYVWNHIMPGTSAAQLPQFGNTNITAAAYVAALQSAGLAGYRWRAA